MFAEMHLYVPETYAFLGLISDDGSVELEIEQSDGTHLPRRLTETWDRGLADFGWDTLNPFIPEDLLTVHDVLQTEPPYYQRRLDQNVWFEFLDDEKTTMYLQINKQMAPEDGPESIDIILDWATTLWRSEAERLIIDVRNDPGGNIFLGNTISGMLPELYVNHPTLAGIAILLGTDTVSAGTILVAQLERTVAPVLIGDPSGSSPNMFLSADKTILPIRRSSSKCRAGSTSRHARPIGDATSRRTSRCPSPSTTSLTGVIR